MKNIKPKRGAPKKPLEKSKSKLIQVRASLPEKQAFSAAADLDGKTLSVWIRDRLRKIAHEELERHGQQVPF